LNTEKYKIRHTKTLTGPILLFKHYNGIVYWTLELYLLLSMSVVVFSSACFSFSAALFSEDQLSILGMAGLIGFCPRQCSK